jgi:hypothetical protein
MLTFGRFGGEIVTILGHIRPKITLFAAIYPVSPKRLLPQKSVSRNVSHGPPLGSVSFVFSPIPTWLEQKPIKNHWQPLPHQIALLLIGTLARGTQKKSLPGVKNNISIAISVYLEQGNLLSQRAPILFLI